MKYHQGPTLRESNKKVTTKNSKNFRKIFDEFSVNDRQIAGDSYLC